jgi:hypothetical protein
MSVIQVLTGPNTRRKIKFVFVKASHACAYTSTPRSWSNWMEITRLSFQTLIVPNKSLSLTPILLYGIAESQTWRSVILTKFKIYHTWFCNNIRLAAEWKENPSTYSLELLVTGAKNQYTAFFPSIIRNDLNTQDHFPLPVIIRSSRYIVSLIRSMLYPVLWSGLRIANESLF